MKLVSTTSGYQDVITFNKTMQLFKALNRKLNKFDLTERQKDEIREDVYSMAQKDLETTRHVLNVTLLSMEIATFLGRSEKPFLFSGPGHDKGKEKIKDTILNAEKYGKRFGKAERKAMRPHPVDSFYHFLNMGKTYSALVAVNHHRHSDKPYPRKLPIEARSIPHSRKLQANEDSKILTIADTLDALLERPTSHLLGKPITPKIIHQELLRFAPKAAKQINLIYERGFITQERIAKCSVFKKNVLREKRVLASRTITQKPLRKKIPRRKKF